tara:strand:+ start:399 stop:644 length:246 start_codon:yes stop_codon:yes gene_type:complete
MEEKLSEKLSEQITHRDNLQKDINYSYRFINDAKQKIKELERFIWKNCQHEWVYLDDGDYYSRIKYKCKHCDLYRNQYMYN